MERAGNSPFLFDVVRVNYPEPLERPLLASLRALAIIDRVKELIGAEKESSAYTPKDQHYSLSLVEQGVWQGILLVQTEITALDIDSETGDERITYGDEICYYFFQKSNGTTRILIEQEKFNNIGEPFSAEMYYEFKAYRPFIEHRAQGFDCDSITKRQRRLQSSTHQGDTFYNVETLIGNIEKTIKNIEVYAMDIETKKSGQDESITTRNHLAQAAWNSYTK